MDILIGYSGFVGSNLRMQHQFHGLYNSKNIDQAFGTNPDLCVYSGVRAEKYLANNNPEKDLIMIEDAISNIKKINPKRLVLISTIDVFLNSDGADESTRVTTEGLNGYGINRYYLEQWVQNNIKHHNIIRLPGLFGKNIKKNFIYDMVNILPTMLKESKYLELVNKEPLIEKHYLNQNNGFYKCSYLTKTEKEALKQAFVELDFTALNFTDSRSVFQFYNLEYIWKHIQLAFENEIGLLHLAVEPVAVNELYQQIYQKKFNNEIILDVPYYNFKTQYAELFGGKRPYIFGKQQIINEILKFVESERL